MSPFALWRNLRAAVAVGREINDIRDEWDEVRLDWADKRDAIDRLLRRLTLRESRSRPSEGPQEPLGTTIPTAPTNGDLTERKRALWARVRKQGVPE